MKLDSSNAVQAEADAEEQHHKTKKADEDHKHKFAEQEAAQPTVGLGVLGRRQRKYMGPCTNF